MLTFKFDTKICVLVVCDNMLYQLYVIKTFTNTGFYLMFITKSVSSSEKK